MIRWISGCGLCPWSFSGKVGAYVLPMQSMILNDIMYLLALSVRFLHITTAMIIHIHVYVTMKMTLPITAPTIAPTLAVPFVVASEDITVGTTFSSKKNMYV